jgi:hypothetical protein
LRQTLHDKIQNIPGIQRTETFISLEETVDRPLNILDDEDQAMGQDGGVTVDSCGVDSSLRFELI